MRLTELYLTLDIRLGADDPNTTFAQLRNMEGRIYRKGDPLGPKSRRFYEQNGISYRKDPKQGLNLDTLITDFFADFDLKEMKAVLEKYTSEFCSVTWIADRSAELWISPKNLKLIADLNLDFGVDYYILPAGPDV
jgi:hypothetical protein